MSKNSKKQRAKAEKAQVRRESGTVLRAVTPPTTGGKVLELNRPRAELLPTDAPAQLATDDVESTSTEVSPAAPLEEHRASPRVSLAVDIHLSSDSHFFSGLSGDISEGGLFLSTYRALTVGTHVDVEFSLPGTKRPIHARGEVRWIREHSAEQPRGVGIAFEALAEEDREEIHAFCSSRPPLYYDVD